MTNLDVFEAKKQHNKWLNELSESEKKLIMDMLEEIRNMGYNEGQEAAHQSFQDVCSYHGFK